MHFSSELGVVEWHKYKSNVQLPQQVISSHPPLDGTQHPWPSANRIHFHWSPERAMAGLLKVPRRGTERVYCTYHSSIYTWHGHLPPHAHPSPYSLPSASLSIIPVHNFMPLDSISQLLWGKQIFFSCLMEEQLHLFFSVLGVVIHWHWRQYSHTACSYLF